MQLKRFPIVFLCVALLVMTACSRQEEGPPASAQKETPVIVPQEVVESWKAVKITALDLVRGNEQVYVVDIGGEFSVPGSSLVVKVDHFLPSFVRDGKAITTSSNLLDNPAVKIRVLENGQESFSGWLFELYPHANNFRHNRFGFRLVGQIPAQKKG